MMVLSWAFHQIKNQQNFNNVAVTLHMYAYVAHTSLSIVVLGVSFKTFRWLNVHAYTSAAIVIVSKTNGFSVMHVCRLVMNKVRLV